MTTHWMLRRCFVLMLALSLPAFAAHAQTLGAPGGNEPRLALVIGNGAYRGQALKNAVNDARAMAASLRRLDFAVIERTDAGKKAMEDAVLEFGEKLREGGGVGLFYYAGHGLQVRGRNYLVPIDAALPSEASVRVQAVDVDLVLEQLNEARNRANVVILDACRNNPFAQQMRGAPAGLAAIDAARGTLIAYSTAPGKVASDGGGPNSPYTAALVKTLDEPGLKAEDVFKRVRAQVADATKGAQTPWESSSLTGDLVINLSITINPPAGAPAAAAVGTGRDPADVAFWNSIVQSAIPQDYEDYLQQFPKGTFASLARRRLADAKSKQQAAAEAERKRVAAAEAEHKRKEAEPPRPQQQAAAPASAPAAVPAPGVPADRRVANFRALNERTYKELMDYVLPRAKVADGPDKGKPYEYRSRKQNKAVAMCVDWAAHERNHYGAGPIAKAAPSVKYWYMPAGRSTIEAARDRAMTACVEAGMGKDCDCVMVDENDANVLEAPLAFARRTLVNGDAQAAAEERRRKEAAAKSAIPGPARPAAPPLAAVPPRPGFDGQWQATYSCAGGGDWSANFAKDLALHVADGHFTATVAVNPGRGNNSWSDALQGNIAQDGAVSIDAAHDHFGKSLQTFKWRGKASGDSLSVSFRLHNADCGLTARRTR